MAVIIFHRFTHDWAATWDFFLSEQPWINFPLLTLLMFFIAMGSIFSLISGIVTTYSNYNRISSDLSKMKPIVLASIFMLLWLLLLAYTSRYFFATRTYIRGEFHYGMFTGWLRMGEFHIPSLELMILAAGTLGIIGISGFTVTILLALLFRNGGIEKMRRNKIVLGVFGTLILGISVFSPFVLTPIMYDAFDNGNYFLALILALLIANQFPIFPILGFAIFGTILGLQLAGEEDEKRILRCWLRFALLIAIIGFVLLITFLFQGLFNMNFIRFIQLGFYFFVIIILLKTIDFKTEEKQEKILKRTTPILRFSRVSLTIFILETAIAEIFHFFLDYLIPGWTSNIFMILIFGVFNLALWWIILIFWEKKDFKGSIEWIGARIVQILSGKSTAKLK